MTWLLHFWYMLYESSPETTNITRNLSGRPAHFILGCKFAQQKNTCWMGCGIINYQKACVIGHGIIAVKHAMQGRKTFPSRWMSHTNAHNVEQLVEQLSQNYVATFHRNMDFYCHTQHSVPIQPSFISVVNSHKSVMLLFRLPNSPESMPEDKTCKIQSIHF